MSLTICNKPIGPISFGMMGLTSRPDSPSTEESIKTLKAALDNGSNFWNGGQFYGPPDANSLQLLNAYFTKYPEDKDKICLSMKGGFSMHPKPSQDNSPANVRKLINECLDVLDGKVFLDIWEPSRSDPNVEIEDTIKVIAEYVKAGKVGGIGLSEVNANTIRRAHAVHPISVVEVELSMFTTDALTNDVASTCAELGIALVGYAPLSKGFLTGQIKKFEDIPEGDMRRLYPRFQPDVFDENIKLVNEVEKIAKQKNCTMAQVAIGWAVALGKREGLPSVIPLPGANTVKRVEENSKVVVLDEQDMSHIQEILVRIPIQGHRWPAMLQPLGDKTDK